MLFTDVYFQSDISNCGSKHRKLCIFAILFLILSKVHVYYTEMRCYRNSINSTLHHSSVGTPLLISFSVYFPPTTELVSKALKRNLSRLVMLRLLDRCNVPVDMCSYHIQTIVRAQSSDLDIALSSLTFSNQICWS
uniref:AlNc14C9G1175 protein n=1 Tax=Albugo laibachii Nc14 TaxID=890382 RepID=F0W2C5_9STRA|nr:AlNc14C9G1175 [Albugo laibachii Nc14]|eukprot:CCA15210.1 AlNc14C9G1175 [Albugo laibachii Nc14]